MVTWGDVGKNLHTAGRISWGDGAPALPQLIGRLINVALGFLGLLFICMTLYAGFLWMTAGGSEEKIEHAKDLLKNAVMGLAVIMASFALSNFVLDQILSTAG